MGDISEYLNSHRPDGGRRSEKRDFIVDVFLHQEGHLSADDLVDLIHVENKNIGRATVYRALRWMVDNGIARKVDFGDGRFRYEHSYRHPKHFHLVCQSCSQSSEFLSSDMESFIDEVSDERGFRIERTVVQVYGTCHSCTTGKTDEAVELPTELVFARDALRIAIATERSGLEFYSRAAQLTTNSRGRTVFKNLAEEEEEHLGKLEKRYAELLVENPQLETYPTFLFFRGAADGLFVSGTEELEKGVDAREALMIGIRCERGSHKFFKKYGEKFEDSEGKNIFLEFADEEREHLELLLHEYQELTGTLSEIDAS
tara:strand:+ start:12160 stop:13104 length:945 start_codon:yes stop_codon:yes gene_type:complete